LSAPALNGRGLLKYHIDDWRTGGTRGVPPVRFSNSP